MTVTTDTAFCLPPDATPAELAAAGENVFDAVIRVSRRNGREGDSFMSPPDQVDAILRRAASDGVVIARWFDETDSVSGGSVEREGLQAAVHRACVLHVTKGLYVAKVDRFARTVQGGLSVITTLEDAGRELRSAREGVIVGDEKATATDVLMRTFFLMLAQWQRDTLAEGWEAVTERRVAQGIATHAPYGLMKDVVHGPDGKVVGGTRLLVPEPSEAPWVLRIFEWRADGRADHGVTSGASWNQIVDWLNAEPDAVPRSGGGWSTTTVTQIVANRVYLGEVRAGDVVNENAHDPLVPLALWERANARSQTTKQRREAEQYLLSGIVRCAGCGVRMSARSDVKINAAGETVTYRYYRCRRRYAGQVCSAPALVTADEVEAIAERLFREHFLGDRIAVPSASTTELDDATVTLADAEAELRAFLTSPATAEMRQVLGDEWVDEGQRERVARVKAARERVTAARNNVLGVAFPVGLAETWPTLTVEEQRGFLATGLALVAVARGNEDVPRRVRVWTRNDLDVPAKLPGVENRGVGITPIADVVSEAA